MKTHVFLIGEQTLPNLLPLRYYRPGAAIAVYSSRTENAYRRLQTLASSNLRLVPLKVEDAYDIFAVQEAIREKINHLGLASAEWVFNFTGGTKPMSLAAFFLAAEMGAPMVYIQSEGKATRCYEYEFADGKPVLTATPTIPGLITIEEYLVVHTGQGFQPRTTQPDDAGHRFELAIHDALKPPVMDEVIPGASLGGTVDIDFIARCGNQVAVVEAKIGLNKIKHAIDQLATAGEQRFLGTYTEKIIVSDQDLSGRKDRSALMELAKKQRITVIELPGYGRDRVLNDEETRRLQSKIQNALGKNA